MVDVAGWRALCNNNKADGRRQLAKRQFQKAKKLYALLYEYGWLLLMPNLPHGWPLYIELCQYTNAGR